MSKQEKSKRLRKPNIYMGPSGGLPMGAETATEGSPIASRTTSSSPLRAEPAPVKINFDYSHIKRDLTRIAILAGSFLAILVVLSFFIK